MKKIFSYVAGAIMLLTPVASGAQVLPFVAADYDAVSLGTAGANLANTNSIANAAFVNAAAIPFSSDRVDVSAGYTMWKPTGGNVLNFAGAFNSGQKFGAALGVVYGTNPAYDITNSSGTSRETFSPTEMQINAGFAWRLLSNVSFGANVGYASNALSPDVTYSSINADVFAMAVISDLKVTAGIANLGGGVKAADGTKWSLPTSLALGVGYGMEFAQVHGVNFLFDADYFLKGGIAASFGAEYAFDNMVFARAGYRYGGASVVPSYASVGAGVKFAGAKLDLAYLIGAGTINNTLALSLGYSF